MAGQPESTCFVAANVLDRKCLFHVEKLARLFIEVMLHYRARKKYLLHEFVVMPYCGVSKKTRVGPACTWLSAFTS